MELVVAAGGHPCCSKNKLSRCFLDSMKRTAYQEIPVPKKGDLMLEATIQLCEQSPFSSYPKEINGVPIWTRSGTPRTRFNFDDKLKILGCTKMELQLFADHMAPRKTPFAITNAKSGDPSDWKTVNHKLALDQIARHLLGDRLPGVTPQWIAPRAWDWCEHVAIDVDLKKDQEDFEQRCKQIEAALDRLDVKPESRLIVSTPSGGRHYYFFTNQRIRTAEIAPIFAKVGIAHCKGKFEIFPSTSNGLRLPFGHIPENPNSPDDWINFIRCPPPGVNWEWCKHLAVCYAKKSRTSSPRKVEEASRTANSKQRRLGANDRTVPLGLSKCDRKQYKRYCELLSRPVAGPEEIDELWALGIREEGTRHEAILRIAWNFVIVRRLATNEVVEKICEWTYRTGCNTSKTVQRDFQNGTKKVEQDIRDLVDRFVKFREQGAHRPSPVFSVGEVECIVNLTASSTLDHQRERSRFLMEFLGFAKSHGSPSAAGWQCIVSAGGVMRTWPRCSGSRYREHLDWAIGQGVIEMTREKRQSSNGTGRPRTYLIRIQPAFNLSGLTHEEAIRELDKRRANAAAIPKNDRSVSEENDRYEVGLPKKREDEKCEAEASDLVRDTKERLSSSLDTKRTTQYQPISTEQKPKEKSNNEYRTADTAEGPGVGNRTNDQRCKHKGRAVCSLATGTPERPSVQPLVPNLRNKTLGPERTAPAVRQTHELADPKATAEAFAKAVENGRLKKLRPTAEEIHALPPPDDLETISLIIRQHREQSLEQPGVDKARVNIAWQRVEKLARHPASCLQRWLLLSHPNDLQPQHQQQRLRILIDENLPKRHRRRRNRIRPSPRTTRPRND